MVEVFLEKIRKVFGKVTAVDNVDLVAEDRKITVLLGPSGCGKSTTLRIIAGLERQDSGHIYVGDNLVDDLSPVERDMAMVFQSYALYPHMTVKENLAFPLEMKKVPKSEVAQRVKESAELLHMTDLLERYPRQLSGGEAQRTALGRAIIRDPKVFLMDEPLSNLDARLRLYMRAELKNLQRKLGITTIYVTHDQEEGMTLGDKMAVIDQGKVMQYGNPSHLFKKPANQFVAGFLGSPAMNFMNCHYETNGRELLVIGEQKLEIPTEIAEIMRNRGKDKDLVFGVRPRDLNVSKRRTPNSLKMKVFVLEHLATYTLMNLEISGDIIKAIGPADFEAEPDEIVYASVDFKKTHMFDRSMNETII